MSLLNANNRNKSDFASAMIPAAQITGSIYRKKAMKALERRNSIMGEESEYLCNLCRQGSGSGGWGLAAEANYYDYIAKYCNMEVKAFETAEKYGGLSPKLMDLLANPPHPSVGHTRKVFYTIKVEILCMLEGFKKRKEKKENNEVIDGEEEA